MRYQLLHHGGGRSQWIHMISDDGYGGRGWRLHHDTPRPEEGRERPPHDTLFPSQIFSCRNTTGKEGEFDQRLGIACSSLNVEF